MEAIPQEEVVTLLRINPKTIPVKLINHEVKSMLTEMYAYIELLQRKIEKNERDKSVEYLDKLRRHTHIFSSFIIDLCDIVKMLSGDFEAQKDYFSFGETMAQVKLRAEKNTEKSIHIKGRLPNNIYGDQKLIARCLLHFITTASYYTNKKTFQVFSTSSRGQMHLRIGHISPKLTGNRNRNLFGKDHQNGKVKLHHDVALFVTKVVAEMHGGALQFTNNTLHLSFATKGKQKLKQALS